MSDAIEAAGLEKNYGSTRALDGLDLSVATGEVHGFLGPNGAGKTTTLRVLLGLIHADRGSVRVLDGDPWKDRIELHRRLAYVAGEVSLWPSLTGGEVIDLLARLRGTEDNQRRDSLIERFELDPTRKIRAYSKGNRQKVALIAALASPVELLLLDEPTSGLDPLMAKVFRDCIGEERAAGRTVLLSSHTLAEVEELCHSVTIIRKGRVVESGSLANLRHLTRTMVIAELERPPDGIASAPGVHEAEVDGTILRCQVDTAELGAFLGRLETLGVRSLTSRPPNLEELFLRAYADGGDGRGAGAQEWAAGPKPGAEKD